MLVSGSRDFRDNTKLCKVLDSIADRASGPVTIIEGGALGGRPAGAGVGGRPWVQGRDDARPTGTSTAAARVTAGTRTC